MRRDGVLRALVLVTALAVCVPIAWLSALYADTGPEPGAEVAGAGIEPAAVGGTWTEMDPVTKPSARMEQKMVYDNHSGRVILFGGGDPGLTNDTWAYDAETNTWTNLAPAAAPPARSVFGMTYDTRSDRAIVFGGSDGYSPLNDTWAYDSQANAWTRMSPAASPPARAYAVLAYDSKADRTILFGGWSSSGGYSDTWAYDFDSNAWEELAPAVAPSPRYYHAMVYDVQSDRIILFGGTDVSGHLADTWAYDYGANEWTEMAPATSPPARDSHSMAYDALSRQVVMFGGWGPSIPGNFADDSWAYDYGTNTWTELAPGTSPPARNSAAMAYDTESDRVVLFGGQVSANVLADDTWIYAALTPSSPKNLVAVEGDGEVALSWDPPVFDGGAPVTNYTIYRGTVRDGESPLATLGAVLTFSDTSLTNGVTYYYQLSASNSAGEGPRCDEISATPATTPSAPQNVEAVAGDAQVVLTWAAPDSDGGASILHFTVYRGTLSGGESLLEVLGNVLTYTDTGLTNGQGYYYTISATNSAGEGMMSPETSATPATTPSAPQTVTVNADDARVVLTWAAPASTGGAAVTGYRVYRGTSAGGESLLATLGDVLTYADTAVTNGITYYYEISAVNAAGEGPVSSEVAGTPFTTPSAPQSLLATPGNAQVVLTWSAPTSTGGAAITGYRVLRGTSPGGETLLATLGTVPTFVDTGLTNGVTYYYEVSATNAAGEGPHSIEVSATPVAPNSAPSASFTISPSTGDTSTSFMFDATACSDAQDASAALMVRWDWQDDGVWDTTWSATKTIQHTYTTAGIYTIRLQVQDSGALTSEITRQVIVTPPTVTDVTKPWVTVTSHANHSTVASATVTISGTASDNVAVQKVELSLDGITWLLASGTNAWSRTMTLAEGSNTVYVRVTDTSGNAATMTMSLTLQTAAGPGAQGLDPTTVVVIVAAVIAAAGVGTALVLVRGRRRAGGKS